MAITYATPDNISLLAVLFDKYRQFYLQDQNLRAATHFLKERLEKDESVIIGFKIENQFVGFMQLYPLFSSVSMQHIYLLNDLFVDFNYRNKGIGKALILEAKSMCQKNGYSGLAIQTAKDNPAQKLYKSMGFVEDTDLHFFMKL
ncbi:MAG: hypothetical protein BM564_07085 [Bacteroidetes bacterium MedPE-SWsnd-G2]|nr:MAG: hypothetical protein BM564_07085 [Bacteroidetes bacterium MedPE-SWsnd-G2]